MTSRLAGFMIDCRNGDLDTASRFWSGALGLSIVDADEGGAGRYAVLSPAAGSLHLEVQMVEHDARLHLDIEAIDVEAEVARLESLGATRVGNPHGRWWVMQAPTGHRFCVVRWREREPVLPPRRAESKSHRSALVAFVLDCQVASLDCALEFWSAALNRPVANRDQDGDGKYGELHTGADEPFLLLQRVDHDPRIHLDIETDNLDAEVARLEALGARRVAHVKRWWVMQAPTGHRFCVVRQQPAKPKLPLNEWPVSNSP
jgi:predicted enzyme related to lactoylglutathione lyase